LDCTASVGVVPLDLGSAQTAADRFKQVVDHSALRLTTLAAIAPLFYGRALANLGRIGSFKLLRTLTRRCRFSRRRGRVRPPEAVRL